MLLDSKVSSINNIIIIKDIYIYKLSIIYYLVLITNIYL